MSTFFDRFPILKLFGHTSDFGNDRGYEYSNSLHFVFYFISAIILVPVFIYYKKNYKSTINSSKSLFGLYGFIFSIGLILLIFVGSILNPSQIEEFNWSWAKIFRYFMLPAFIIQITYILIIINNSSKKMKYFAIMLFSSSLLFSTTLKVYNYTYNYKPFNFEHNSCVQRPNNSLLNSYNLHINLPKDDVNSSVAIIDSDIKKSFFKVNLFCGFNNITTTFIDNSFDFNLKTSKKVTIYLITSSKQQSDPLKKLIKKYKFNLFKTLENNISIYYFNLNSNA